jgi:outer membrane receptor protein involved in Fe transport
MGSRLTLGVEVQGVGERRSVLGDPVPGYIVGDARLTFDLIPRRVQILISGANLLDTPFADPGGEEHRQVAIPQDGRVVRLGVRARL